MTTTFQQTKRFKQAVRLVNNVETKKLSVLLVRTIGGLNEGKSSKQVFSNDERAQIMQLMQLNEHDLDTVLDASCYIFEQAAYQRYTSAKLTQSLVSAGVTEDGGVCFGNVWSQYGEAFVAKLGTHTLGGPRVLDGVKWRLQMTVDHQLQSKIKLPNAVFDLSTHNVLDKSHSNVVFQASHDDLQHLYEQLERIQSQLDALT